MVSTLTPPRRGCALSEGHDDKLGLNDIEERIGEPSERHPSNGSRKTCVIPGSPCERELHDASEGLFDLVVELKTKALGEVLVVVRSLDHLLPGGVEKAREISHADGDLGDPWPKRFGCRSTSRCRHRVERVLS